VRPTKNEGARRLGEHEQYLIVGSIPSEAGIVRPEPFGPELKAAGLRAEGSRRWPAIRRAKRLFSV
jgi:hypothetical protein